MRKPSRTELFEALYDAVAAQGRGAALLGDSEADALAFFRRTLIGGDFPAVYLEFPLAGEPCLDLLSIYDRVPSGAAFASGAGFGYQQTFDWFAGTATDRELRTAIGIELDLSQGVADHAGIYLQQRGMTQLVRPFLQTVGAEGRADAYRGMAERMPRGWPAAYVGLFPARPGTPLRLGGYLSEPSRKRCAADPAFLGSRFDLMGFEAYDAGMLDCCSRLMGLAPAVDFQFDLMPDGSLSHTFGLSLSFGGCRPGDVAACFSQGHGAAVMGLLEQWGLADARWRLIPDTVFARSIDCQRADGSAVRLAASVLLNFAKVKFVDGSAQTAKFYLVMMVRELGA